MIAPSLRPPYLRGLGHRRATDSTIAAALAMAVEVWWGKAGYCRERGVGQQYGVTAWPSSPA